MMRRCHDPKDKSYPWYGARGIAVCERWQSFDAFVEDVGLRPIGMTLDRIDSSKDYEPGNVRWATKSEQMKNRTFEFRFRTNRTQRSFDAFDAVAFVGLLFLEGKTLGEIAKAHSTSRQSVTHTIEKFICPMKFSRIAKKYRRPGFDILAA